MRKGAVYTIRGGEGLTFEWEGGDQVIPLAYSRIWGWVAKLPYGKTVFFDEAWAGQEWRERYVEIPQAIADRIRMEVALYRHPIEKQDWVDATEPDGASYRTKEGRI